MHSMTGFGRGQVSAPNGVFAVEIQAVNRKNLEVSLFGLREFPEAEHLLTARVRSAVHRGNLSISCSRMAIEGVDDREAEGEAALVERLGSLRRVAGAAGLELTVDAGWLEKQLTQEPGSGGEKLPLEAVLPHYESALGLALDSLLEMREVEGRALERDLQARIGLLQGITGEVRTASAAMVAGRRDLLLGRLAELGLELDVGDERVLKEVTLFADRCDIAEELTRLESHFGQFLATMGGEGPCGRKLEFLTQEIHREVNTIGAKGNSLTVGQLILSMKNEIERVREQLANVE